MVDVITPTKTYFGKNGKTPALLLTFAGFNGNGEYGTFDAWSDQLTWIPAGATCIVDRTAGTTAAIDVDVDIAMDSGHYIASDINNITAIDTMEHHPSVNYAGADTAASERWRYWKPKVIDVGAGNTLTVYLWLYPK